MAHIGAPAAERVLLDACVCSRRLAELSARAAGTLLCHVTHD